MTQMVEIINKNIKTVPIAAFQVFKKLEEILNILSRYVADITKTKIEILEMKTKMSEMKNIFIGFFQISYYGREK